MIGGVTSEICTYDPHWPIHVQALADIFSDHEKFVLAELQPFFETSSSLENAPSWGIIDAAFLRHLMSNIKRCRPSFLGPRCLQVHAA